MKPVAGGVAAAFVALVMLACRQPVPGVADAGAARVEAPARLLEVRWPADREAHYLLDWKVEQGVSLPGMENPGASITSTAGVRGTLALRQVMLGGRPVLRLRFATLDSAEVRVADGSRGAALGTADFSPVMLYLEMRPTGQLDTLALPVGVNPLVQQALLLLCNELQVVVDTVPVRVGSSWRAPVATPSGEAQVEWRLQSLAPVRLERRRMAYTQQSDVSLLQSTGNAVLDDGGMLVALDATEMLRAKTPTPNQLTGHLALKRLRLEPGPDLPPPDPATLVKVPALQSVMKTSREAELNQRVGDMTVERAVQDLRGVSADGKLNVPDSKLWLWQVSGLILRHPTDVTAVLERTFHQPFVGDDARNIILDMMASAGHAESQAAMRRILARKDVQGMARFPAWFQRLSMLDEPDQETQSFVERTYGARRNAPLEQLAPVAVTYGAVLRHVRGKADAEAFHQRGLRELLGRLENAPTAPERDAFLRAVGNTGDESALPAILRHESDPDTAVRVMVARNMGNYKSNPVAMDALQRLATDKQPQVASDALTSLGSMPLPPGQRTRLASSTTQGRVPEGAWGGLLNVAAGWVGDATAKPILEYVHSHASDARTAARAGTLLERSTTP